MADLWSRSMETRSSVSVILSLAMDRRLNRSSICGIAAGASGQNVKPPATYETHFRPGEWMAATLLPTCRRRIDPIGYHAL
jgi:hypothetical protein